MNSITQAIENENNLTKRISVFFKKYSIGDILFLLK
jgi:hypothetical protein